MTTTETVSTELLAEWAKRGDDAGRLARELLTIRLNVHHEVHRCFICDEPFKEGQLVLPSEDGLGHRACFGEDRDGYVQDIGSMEPLGPNDPIPAGEPYVPAEYFPVRNAQSEAVAVKALEWGKTSYGTPECVTIAGTYRLNNAWNGGWSVTRNSHVIAKPDDLTNFASEQEAKAAAQSDYEQRIRSALTHPAPPLAVTYGRPTHRHVKRGSEYVLIGVGKMQAENWEEREYTATDEPVAGASVDMREVAIYRDVDDGSLWARPREEFEDGRFEALTAALEAKQ